MASRSHLPSFPEASSAEVARALYGPLEAFFLEQCINRYDTRLRLQCLDLRRVEGGSEDVSLMEVQVYGRGLTKMRARLFVTCPETIGYDVLCTVVEGATHRFSYHLPRPDDPSSRELRPLAQDLATFLRREFENRLGRLLLQSPARPPREDEGPLPL